MRSKPGGRFISVYFITTYISDVNMVNNAYFYGTLMVRMSSVGIIDSKIYFTLG